MEGNSVWQTPPATHKMWAATGKMLAATCAILAATWFFQLMGAWGAPRGFPLYTIQWRYYGPFCARQSFKGLFWQNGPVFGPFLPPESSFSLNLCKQRQHHLPWWLQHPHSQASLFQCWRQFINSNRLLFKSLSLKFQILFDSFFFLICLCEYILVAFYVNVQFRLGRKRGS